MGIRNVGVSFAHTKYVGGSLLSSAAATDHLVRPSLKIVAVDEDNGHQQPPPSPATRSVTSGA